MLNAILAFALAILFYVFALPRLFAWWKQRNEISRLEKRIDDLCKHRESLQSHISWARDRGENKEVEILTAQLRTMHAEIRQVETSLDKLTGLQKER
jgi:prefoldin subunit 5